MTSETSFSKVTDLFAYLKEQHNYYVSAPIDVDKIATLLSIDVEEDFAESDFIGRISFEKERPKITINILENTYEPRRRFTLAHELAHYCLHSNKQKAAFVDTRKTMDRSGSYWDTYESEANAFAARLLMPKSIIVSEGNSIIDTYKSAASTKGGMPRNDFIDAMAKRFNVSNAAMEYRLINLAIIKPRTNKA